MATKVRYYEFIVEGTGEFPYDMLRYDACYPSASQDVQSAFSFRIAPREVRRVKLVSTVKQPTEDRWLSFGWKVLETRKVY
jgi:hypothetical protein